MLLPDFSSKAISEPHHKIVETVLLDSTETLLIRHVKIVPPTVSLAKMLQPLVLHASLPNSFKQEYARTRVTPDFTLELIKSASLVILDAQLAPANSTAKHALQTTICILSLVAQHVSVVTTVTILTTPARFADQNVPHATLFLYARPVTTVSSF